MYLCCALRGEGLKITTMTVSEQLEKFIAENGGNERDALNVALARLELAEKQLSDDAWRIDSEAMAKVMLDQSIETQAKERLDAFIKHEREQRSFIAANSAMNGLLANPQTQTVGSYATGSEIAHLAISYATCLLAELETTNQSNPKQ